MKANQTSNLEQHITVLGWLHIALNAISLFAAVVVLLIVPTAGILSGDADAAIITSIVGVSVAAFLLLISAPGLVAGIGLLKRKSWARVLALVLSFFYLLNFPVGTAVGAYTLWALLQEESQTAFMTPKSA